LRQQERQNEQKKSPLYQPSRELLFASLFYQDYLTKLLGAGAFVEALTSFALQIATTNPEGYLAKALKGTLNDSEHEEINEIQLRWEKELGEI